MNADAPEPSEGFEEDGLRSGALRERTKLPKAVIDLLEERRDEIRRMVEAGVEQLDRGETVSEEDVFC
jgi:hypothetical protein